MAAIRKRNGFSVLLWVLLPLATLVTLTICVSVGSVRVPLKDTFTVILCTIFGEDVPAHILHPAIIARVRLPRVLCVALVGASLSLWGASMQGLLKNPLAGTVGMAMLFAFLSLLFILTLAFHLDRSLSTNTIILIGVVYSMFVSSAMSLIVTFASDRLRQITFWTMGSLAGSSYTNALMLLVAFIVFGGAILLHAGELNAFAVGEDNARFIGVNVRCVKLRLLVCVSALIGVCVSIGGSIGFVGLVTPHIVRLLTGPNHKRLLPACAFGGAIFLMLSDLVARTLLSPLELPIGVVTSLIGAALFIYIFAKSGRKSRA